MLKNQGPPIQWPKSKTEDCAKPGAGLRAQAAALAQQAAQQYEGIRLPTEAELRYDIERTESSVQSLQASTIAFNRRSITDETSIVETCFRQVLYKQINLIKMKYLYRKLVSYDVHCIRYNYYKLQNVRLVVRTVQLYLILFKYYDLATL